MAARRRSDFIGGDTMDPLVSGGFAPGEPYPQQAPSAPAPLPEAPPVQAGPAPSMAGWEGSKLEREGAHNLKYSLGDALASGQYGFQDQQRLLEDLQAGKWGVGDAWQGWTVAGDKFRYQGEGPQTWDGGIDEIDFIRNYTQEGGGFDPSKSGFWWGATGPTDRMGGGGGGNFLSMPTGGFGSGGGGGTGGGSGSSSSFTRPVDFGGLKEALAGLFPGGAFNQDIVNRRTDSARTQLEKQRKQRMATNQALLADRGLIGDGPERTAYANMEDSLYDTFSDAVSNIYADESENADQRMISALQIAAGMTESEARSAVDMFRATNDRDIGFGNLAARNKEADQGFSLGQGRLGLDSMRSTNDYNLGLANYGLARDQFLNSQNNTQFDQYLALIQMMMQGAGQAGGGYI